MIFSDLSRPGFCLFGLYFNRHTATVADQVMMMVFRAVSKQAFSCIYQGISQAIGHKGV
jgi:hypothetical protein